MVEVGRQQPLKHQNLKVMRREKKQEQSRAYLYQVSQMAGCLELFNGYDENLNNAQPNTNPPGLVARRGKSRACLSSNFISSKRAVGVRKGAAADGRCCEQNSLCVLHTVCAWPGISLSHSSLKK